MLFGLKGLFAGNVIANVVMASISFVVFKRAIAQFESDNAVLNKVV